MLINANTVHSIFQSCYERIKILRGIAFFIDLVNVVIIVVNTCYRFQLAPLLVLIFAIVSYVFRLRSDFIRVLAEKSRRASVRAYAFCIDISNRSMLSIIDDSPSVWKLKEGEYKTLDDYYTVSANAGQDRLRKAYIHSSYFSWYLLKITSCFYGVAFLVLMLISVVVFFLLASDVIGGPVSTPNILAIFCCVVLANYAIKCFDRLISICVSFMQIKAINEKLIDASVDDVEPLSISYDSLIEKSHYIPTFIHKYNNVTRTDKWKKLQAEINVVVQLGDEGMRV